MTIKIRTFFYFLKLFFATLKNFSFSSHRRSIKMGGSLPISPLRNRFAHHPSKPAFTLHNAHSRLVKLLKRHHRHPPSLSPLDCSSPLHDPKRTSTDMANNQLLAPQQVDSLIERILLTSQQRFTRIVSASVHSFFADLC